MGFKTGLVIGGTAGYVLGARAGRERYQQIKDLWQRLMGNERVQAMTDKGKAAADKASQRVRGGVEDTLHNASEKVRDVVDQIGNNEEG